LNQKICFIGAGNMATSLIGGMLDKLDVDGQITACDIDSDRLQELAGRFGIQTSTDNFTSAQHAQIIVLAVKPQVMRDVCAALAELPPNPQQLFISIAAGVPIDALDAWLGGGRAIVRCMPNTPALIGLGASGLYANAYVSEAQRSLAQQILEAVGIAIWVDDEADLDAVTAISGSGPAYFFYFIELGNNFIFR